MNQSDVFGNLKQAFEEAVSYVVKNGVPKENETRRSELILAVLNEASRRKDRDLYNPTVIADSLTGRLKYHGN